MADGRVVDCDQHHDQQMFWALRGAGGGNFGVVTSLVFRTLPPPPGHLFTKSEFFRQPLPPETITALVEHLAGGVAGGPTRAR